MTTKTHYTLEEVRDLFERAMEQTDQEVVGLLRDPDTRDKAMPMLDILPRFKLIINNHLHIWK